MRIKKLMNDTFYSNSVSYSAVTSVDSLSTDLYFHFTDTGEDKWKISGNTVARASGVILEDSDTTAITVTPTGYTNYTGNTQQLTVVNQDGINVISECTFTRSNSGASVSSGGLITVLLTGSTTITTTHADGPTGTTIVTGYWPGPMTLYPSVNNAPPQVVSGITGTTLQFTLTANNGKVITTQADWTISATGVTIGAATGLATISAGAASQTATVTATYAAATGTPCAPSTTFTIYGV